MKSFHKNLLLAIAKKVSDRAAVSPLIAFEETPAEEIAAAKAEGRRVLMVHFVETGQVRGEA